MTPIDKKELLQYINTYLDHGAFEDASKNGLQVDSSKEKIQKLGYAVDATSYIFEKGKQAGVDAIFTHHGIFWGHEEVLAGVPYKRAKLLLENDIALISSHLPLDAHNEVGNNIGLLQGFRHIFGIDEEKSTVENFGSYRGKTIGFGLRFSGPNVHVSSLQTLFADGLGLQKKFYNFGNKTQIQSICFVSGQGAKAMQEAYEKGYDVLVTGEAVHSEICKAKELGLSLFLGGHYETEKIGPKLLAHHLQKKFGIEVEYLDEKY